MIDLAAQIAQFSILGGWLVASLGALFPGGGLVALIRNSAFSPVGDGAR